MQDHICNAYCTETEHCELVYTDDQATPDHIWQSMGYHRGLKVTRVLPASEAPPAEAQPSNRMDTLQRGSRPLTTAWLVYWL